MRIPLTRYAIPEICLFVVVFGGATALAIGYLPWLAPVTLFGLGFIVNFFRDPERPIPGDDATLVSPADGTVTDITDVKRVPYLDGPARRIGIFLSVFDVHVNRVPLRGEVRYVQHKPGKYLDARDPECGRLNESQDLGLMVELPDGRRVPVLVRQIAGLIARRIICPAKPGDRLARGERYGMIRFGSRTEVYWPASVEVDISVKPGDKVKGGSAILGRVLPAGSVRRSP